MRKMNLSNYIEDAFVRQVTTEYLKQQHNSLLSDILHRMEAVEKIGSSIRRIRDLCREHGVAEPVIEVSEHWVTTTFLRPTGQVAEQPESQLESQPANLSRLAKLEKR